MKLVPSTPAGEFTLSAIIVGYILLNKSTPAEQNSLGNWFMLVGQVLCTNSAQQQVLNNRNKTSNQTNQHIINDTLGRDYQNSSEQEQINMLQRVVDSINEELSRIKANKNY